MFNTTSGRLCTKKNVLLTVVFLVAASQLLVAQVTHMLRQRYDFEALGTKWDIETPEDCEKNDACSYCEPMYVTSCSGSTFFGTAEEGWDATVGIPHDRPVSYWGAGRCYEYETCSQIIGECDENATTMLACVDGSIDIYYLANVIAAYQDCWTKETRDAYLCGEYDRYEELTELCTGHRKL